jgi:membrane protease YdiL (CAAX protease family)
MTKEAITKDKIIGIKNATILSTYLIIVWGLYRFLFKLPEEIEEIIIKPVFWLVPTFYFVYKEGQKLSSVGITLKKLFPAIYLSLGLGVLFLAEALLVNYLKYGNFQFGANIGQKAFFVSLALSFATAVSEEITFRGYLFTRVWKALGNEWTSNILTTAIWTLIHVPISIFVWKFDLTASLTYLFLTTIFGLGSCFVFARTKNIISSIFLHILWEWPIVLFR